jgi:hypothetical protein
MESTIGALITRSKLKSVGIGNKLGLPGLALSISTTS